MNDFSGPSGYDDIMASIRAEAIRRQAMQNDFEKPSAILSRISEIVEETMPEPAPAPPAPAMTPNDAFNIVVRMFNDDPQVFGRKLIEAMGGFAAIAKLKPVKPVVPMPFDNVAAIECCLSDREKHGKREVKRDRQDRPTMRYRMAVQVWQTGTNSLDCEDKWEGFADLRDMDRAKKDIAARSSPKKLYPFSREYVDWLTNTVLPFCSANDLMVGFIECKDEGGQRHIDGQVIVVPVELLGGSNDRAAMLMSMTGENFTLPDFEPTDFRGRPLKMNFIRQSRGLPKYPFSPFANFQKWGTGKLK